jgi:ribosomal protein S18 acetylase RimI-like enzyme
MRVVVRPVEPKDVTTARAVILEGLRERWGYLDPLKNPDLNDLLATYAGSVFVVAELDGEIVGTGALVARGRAEAQVVRMSVAKSRRRSGVGSAVLAVLLEAARSRGCRRIVLETASSWTDAREFYEHHGFQLSHYAAGDAYFFLDLYGRHRAEAAPTTA